VGLFLGGGWIAAILAVLLVATLVVAFRRGE
jgi:hypothetical protein